MQWSLNVTSCLDNPVLSSLVQMVIGPLYLWEGIENVFIEYLKCLMFENIWYLGFMFICWFCALRGQMQDLNAALIHRNHRFLNFLMVYDKFGVKTLWHFSCEIANSYDGLLWSCQFSHNDKLIGPTGGKGTNYNIKSPVWVNQWLVMQQ